jgi:hypothetical protein
MPDAVETMSIYRSLAVTNNNASSHPPHAPPMGHCQNEAMIRTSSSTLRTDGRVRHMSRRALRTNSGVAALSAVLASLALATGGCGSGSTKTVSVSSSPVPASATKTATNTSGATTSTTPTATTPAQTTTDGGVEATRTSTAPAFTKHPSGGEGLNQAMAVVKAHGFSANDTSNYHSEQTLQVLVGTRTGSGDGYGQQAFFFVDNRYIGTDTSQPSASVKVVSQSDTEVTLAYPLYKAHDPLCCPGGGQATVRFQLNNGHLVALDPIPPVSSQTGLSRQ